MYSTVQYIYIIRPEIIKSNQIKSIKSIFLRLGFVRVLSPIVVGYASIIWLRVSFFVYGIYYCHILRLY